MFHPRGVGASGCWWPQTPGRCYPSYAHCTGLRAGRHLTQNIDSAEVEKPQASAVSGAQCAHVVGAATLGGTHTDRPGLRCTQCYGTAAPTGSDLAQASKEAPEGKSVCHQVVSLNELLQILDSSSIDCLSAVSDAPLPAPFSLKSRYWPC